MTATLLGNIKGPAGNGIDSITSYSTSTNSSTGVTTTTYKITYTDENVSPTYFDVLSGATGATGAQGPKGDTGEGFSISQTYATIAAMNADAENVDEGEFVLIASANGAEDEDNAKLYVKGASSFTFLTDLSGAQGIQGVGISSVTAGTVSGTPGEGATRQYNITLTNSQSGGQITVKDGLKGNTGETGPQGVGISSITAGSVSGTQGNGATRNYTVNLTNSQTTSFSVQDGVKGDTGATGAAGADGLIPKLTLDSSGNLYVEYVSSIDDL